MRWEDVEIGDPGPGQVRLRHTAVGLNYRDIYVRNGVNALKSFPSGIGIESAGVIEAVGPGVTGITLGQRVACVAGPDDAYAEARLAPAARVVPLPDEIDDSTAASMMIRGMTARYLLRDTCAVKPGDAILIHAAAGGVGLIVCQWAKQLGATVIGTVGTPEKAELARAHGCDHPIIYTSEDFAGRVRMITGGAGVAVVYDSIGKATFEGSLRCLRPRGVLASFGESSGDPEPIAPRRLGQLGSIFLTHPSLPDYTATREALLAAANDLFDMVKSGRVKIRINQTYPLAEAARAHRDMESRKTTGSTVLIP
ncbi:MAG: quinone oxidoreductase [Gammaproteobacteria bacterium RIFCSPLOWO2_02_FULL_61_13]|nr:MAG: quinone oxidoreductase [Gammaproteobacteria bacterium RIFCSPLOWO2_02_FULL_61_13]